MNKLQWVGEARRRIKINEDLISQLRNRLEYLLKALRDNKAGMAIVSNSVELDNQRIDTDRHLTELIMENNFLLVGIEHVNG